MNFDTQMQQIELSRDQAKEQIKMGEALERLQSNPDFVKVINEGFLNSFALSQVYSLADPGYQYDKDKAGLVNSLQSVAEVRAYFRAVYHNADSAEAALEQYNTTEAELIEEHNDNSL